MVFKACDVLQLFQDPHVRLPVSPFYAAISFMKNEKWKINVIIQLINNRYSSQKGNVRDYYLLCSL